ncbi:zinc ribbon domain-containing protein, partial [Streptosporangium sp. NPDC023615]|uniref:zinc ribbon domain-containing protein n=1 Tax=Streptosporangium sp. NPDC023615 TaxID=3154794 RepID=UPI003448EBF8
MPLFPRVPFPPLSFISPFTPGRTVRLRSPEPCSKAPGRVQKIDPRFTSQTRNVCGHRAGESRESQALFRCVACGRQVNADVNAARDIRDTAAGHAVAARGGSPLGRPLNREPQRDLLFVGWSPLESPAFKRGRMSKDPREPEQGRPGGHHRAEQRDPDEPRPDLLPLGPVAPRAADVVVDRPQLVTGGRLVELHDHVEDRDHQGGHQQPQPG